MKQIHTVHTVVVLLMLALATGAIIACNEQQAPSSAQQAPAAPAVVVQTSPPAAVTNLTPVVANQPQEVSTASQPKSIWTLPAAWALAKEKKLSFVTLQDMLVTNWMVVLDNSGSMKSKECSGQDNRMVAGGKAVISFSRQRPVNDNFGLVLFTDKEPYARVAVPLGRNRILFEQEVHKASADFSTPLGPAIESAHGELFEQGRQQNWHGVYHIVIVTDGDHNQGPDPSPIVKRIVSGSPIQVHTVGFCTGSGHRLNIPGYTTYASAGNAHELNAGLQAVLNAESETFVNPRSE